MSETTTAHAHAASGRLTVGDYVGHAAGEAAQAVRRAGLRPGLDRSLGHDPALAGQVVDQEPEPGCTLARNGLVTLFVAAPGPGREDDDMVSGAAARPTRSPPSRNRPRRAARRGAVSPPEANDTRTATHKPPRTDDVDHDEPGERTANDEPATEGLDDGLVARANELFAARAAGRGRAWRSDRARPRLIGMLARSRGRSLLVRAAGAALALWFLIGVVTALSGHRAAPHRAPPAARTATPRPRAARTSTPPTRPRASDQAARGRRRSARRSRAAQPRRPERVRVVTVVSPPARSVSAPAPPPVAAAPSAPTPEQTGGGPFSP